MDDLERIRELYGTRRPDPQAQGRVWRRVTGRRRRSRLSWLMIPAVAAAVALAFVVLHEPPVSGRSVLLAAATSAASVPGAEGTYWHIKKVRNGSEVTELWVARDGRAWTSDGERVSPVTGRSPFSMAGRDLTFEQIQGLPADPAALKERVAAMLPSNTPGLLADALSGLLWTKPSPPAVRAAAYRVLAELPEVRYLGESPPGEAFSYVLANGNRRTLVIDAETSQVLSSTDSGPSPRTERVIEAGWTDRGPR
ncbi:hypothetical protein GCM10022224_094610 [Nonomuraea antimicrobica]|uniref:CU044_5270 family protein n=1 Tax=Nonomuraea antimicrobica TaxID=561173 RepID=A0ABP7E463_9ACTN